MTLGNENANLVWQLIEAANLNDEEILGVAHRLPYGNASEVSCKELFLDILPQYLIPDYPVPKGSSPIDETT
ncbi:hypothetical protein GCM10029978_047510 [Actinoallomurus acanthiterrae]